MRGHQTRRPPRACSSARRLTHATRRNRGHRDLEQLERENQRLREGIAERDRVIADRDTQIAERDHQIKEHEQTIAELERQLAARQQNSTTSSKPPSSDGLAGAPRVRGRRKKSRRRPGGQPGHRGAYHPLVPPEQVSRVETVWPEQCAHCGQRWPGEGHPMQIVGQVRRHQVTEIPAIAPEVIEYQCPRVLCPGCGQGTRAPMPVDAQGQFGPHLTALIAYLTVVCRLPRRVVEAMLEHLLGIEMSLGSTQHCWEETSAAVAAPCAELEQRLKAESVLNIDETGWRTNGKKRYLWAFVASTFVVFTVAQTRGSALLIQMLGAAFRGILGSDRFSAYLKYHKGQAQFCWAHLKRNMLGILDLAKTREVERFCRDALALHARLFRLWHQYRSGLIDRSQLNQRSIPIEQKFFALAERHLDSADKDVRNLATALFQHGERLFTFVTAPGVEPTNNSAERALRTGVQWRKICFGTRSGRGEIATARLLTVMQTCKQQRRHALRYLTAAVVAHRRRQSVPSLLPDQA